MSCASFFKSRLNLRRTTVITIQKKEKLICYCLVDYFISVFVGASLTRKFFVIAGTICESCIPSLLVMSTSTPNNVVCVDFTAYWLIKFKKRTNT